MAKSTALARQIKKRLTAVITAVWVMVTLLVSFSMIFFYHSDQEYSRALHQIGMLQDSAMNLNTELISEVLNTRAFLISGEESAATRRRLAHDEVIMEMETINRLTSGQNASTSSSLNEIQRLHSEYDGVADQLFELNKTGRTTEALQLFDARSDPLVLSIQSASSELQDEIQQDVSRLNNDFSKATVQVILIIGAAFLAGLALSGFAMIHWVSPLLRSLDYFESTLINAASTQVFHPIDTWPEDRSKPVRLVEAYNQMALRLTAGSTSIIKYMRTMHHEANTHMAAIIGYGYLLSDPAVRTEAVQVEEFSKIIVQQGFHVTHLIEDFTLAARIEGSDFAPTLMPLHLAPLLFSVVEDLKNESMRERYGEIRLHNCADTVMVVGDALSLENAFNKVIKYALKSSPKDSPILIAAEVSQAPHCVKVCVCDTGPGIPAKDLPELFQPFSRTAQPSDSLSADTGLGLFIASAIMRVHRGSIAAESQPGKGTIFTITLPLEAI